MLKEHLKLQLDNDNHLIVKNFIAIKDLKKEIISFDNYIIIGTDLKIEYLDENKMEIYGKIKQIEINSWKNKETIFI